ncbi:hypothetical protein KRX19_04360 [Cardiobacteriaceae bacterium TAE3-ERU3]|nr:hypothetical protein [Cardiobacteriaceae bacterium TAE3-ERU3]
MPNPAELLPFVHLLCDEAAKITLNHFRQSIDVMQKKDASPVTIADQNTEAMLRKQILKKYPNHAIIGEEFGLSGGGEWQWVIDPIDGTRSFISGFPTYATLIALLHHQQPVLSVIDMPALGERFVAIKDRPTTLNGQSISVSSIDTLNNAKLQSTDPGMFTQQQWQKRQQLAKNVALDRFNGDGYLYAMLAAGWIDLVVEADLKPHDFLPLLLIVEQAGGMITDWSGNPLTAESDGEVIAAATSALHQAALKQLQSTN